jgi:hypothetical protein
MGSAHEFVLYLPYGSRRMHDAIVAPIPDDYLGQHFTRLGSDDDDDYPGSGQAGAIAVYVLHYRKGSTSDVVDHLRAVFEDKAEAVLLVSGEYIYGPTEVHRLGPQPSDDEWRR